MDDNVDPVIKGNKLAANKSVTKLSDDYNNVPDVPMESLYQRILPRQMSTGMLRGTQEVGSGGVKIDSANNRITVGNILLDGNTDTISTENSDGSKVGMGLIPGTTNEFGQFSTDSDGNVVWSQVGPTGKITDVANSKGIILDGKLPDGTYGSVMAKVGTEVEDVFD
jgi:hypothetical protein